METSRLLTLMSFALAGTASHMPLAIFSGSLIADRPGDSPFENGAKYQARGVLAPNRGGGTLDLSTGSDTEKRNGL